MAVKTLTGNPIVVASGDTFTTVPATSRVKVSGVYWDAGQTPAEGDVVVIAHADGSVLWSDTMTADQLWSRGIQFSPPLDAKGLAITAPAQGTLYVYLADAYC